MNELVKIQHCLILCEYWNFIETLKNHIEHHTILQINRIQQYNLFKKHTKYVSNYKNIPEELQYNIFSFFYF